MIISQRNRGFNYITGNVLSTRPAGVFGTSIIPDQNAFGDYTEILGDASVTKDCYGILLCINSIGVSTQATDSLTTIGIDTAGGTSYVDFIPNLLTSAAAGLLAGGIWYYFPLYIPAGTAIAAKGSINNATVGTQNIACWLYGAPIDPSHVVAGQGVESIGITAASSSGTAVTAGEADEGEWTSLGTTTKDCFAWQQGIGISDTTMTLANTYAADLSFGDGTNQTMLEQDKLFTVPSVAETLTSRQSLPVFYPVPAGSTIYGRLQCSGTADSSLSMAAYGVY